MIRSRIAFLFVMLVLAGCSSKRSDVYVDPTLDARAFDAAPITVLGVVSLAGDDDDDTRIAHRERVLMEMRAERGELRWADPSTTWIRLGPEEAHTLLDSYRNSARFTSDQLDRLAVIGDHARFVLVGRIDLDMVSYDYDRQEREVSGRWVMTVEPRARREMGVGFDVFDTQSRRLVYTIHLQRMVSERAPSIDVEMLETSPTEADYEQAVRELFARESLPAPPSRGDVLAVLAREAARTLPGRSRGR